MFDFVFEDRVLTKYTGKGGKVLVPKGVLQIGNYAFRGKDNITQITLQDGITTIGAYAFSQCTCLTRIELPDGVTTIGNGAFSGCTGLRRVVLPESLTEIGPGAFSGCTDLVDVFLPKGLTEIGDGAFEQCDSIRRFQVDGDDPIFKSENGLLISQRGDVRELEACPGGMSGSVTVPDGVGRIGGSAFKGCRRITEIHIPEGVTSIGPYAFWGCDNLKRIVLPDSVREIGGFAFFGCKKLKTITLPRVIQSVGDKAFDECDKLELEISGDALKSVMAFYRGTGELPITVLNDDGSVDRMVGCFEEASNSRILLPVGDEDISRYDLVTASARYDGYRMSSKGRLRAALNRLLDEADPVDEKLRGQMIQFLGERVQSAVKLAKKEKEPRYIQVLIQAGLINGTNKDEYEKILKLYSETKIAAVYPPPRVKRARKSTCVIQEGI